VRRFAATMMVLLALSSAHAHPNSVIVAVQDVRPPAAVMLWSFRDQLRVNPIGTLPAIRKLGFTHVELHSLYGLTPEALDAALKANGLTPIGFHFPLPQLDTNLDEVIRISRLMKLGYVGVSWLKPDDAPDDALLKPEWVDDAARVMNAACPRLRAAGVRMFYHVHGYEFARDPDGRGDMMDRFLAKLDPACPIALQVDVFWVKHGGRDPVAFIRKYGKRVELLHLKDMRRGTETGVFSGETNLTNFVALGDGVIDMKAVMREARRAGVKWYIAEDESPDVWAQILRTIAWLRAHKVSGK
jgi:sugar phosphate isomerase/epimerase